MRNLPIETELDHFIKSFADEAELRKAVISLLEKMPLVNGIRDTHGSGEIGKDVVFEMVDPFYGKSLQACVIKNSPISGSVQSNHGARTVVFQAKQVLDSPIRRTTDGVPERIQRVLVISPYECTPQTMESIYGELENKDTVRFLCGRVLWDKFVEHHPKYILDHTSSIARLAATIVSALDSDGAVEEALRQHGFSALPQSLRGTYIQPRFSKRFDRFYLYVELPKAADLASIITKRQANSIARQFISSADLIHVLGKSYDASSASFDYRVRSKQMVAEIRNAWGNAFKMKLEVWREKSGKLPAKRRPKPPSISSDALALANGRRLAKDASALVTLFANSVDQVQATVDVANHLCQTVGEAKKWFDSSFLAPYSLIENLSYGYSGLIQRNKQPSSVITVEKALIDDPRESFLIAGPPGTGKTSFCRWKVMQDLESLSNGTSKTVSQYIPLHKLSGRNPSTFEEMFLFDPEVRRLWQQRHSHQWLFRLYLDGLDELADTDVQQKVLELALEAKKMEARLSFLVTGRDYISVPALRHFIRITVERFDDLQLEEFIHSWFKHNDETEERFRAQLRKVPILKELMRIPLLGALIVNVHQSMRSLPSSRVKLYSMFTELLAGGWDFAKQINRGSKFGPEPKIAVLANLAHRLHVARLREFQEDHFKAAVKEVLPFYASQSPELLVELCQDGLIVTEGQYFGFLHHSIQEYLTATGLVGLGGEKARQAFRRFLSGDDWWGEPVKFAIALSRNPNETRRYIENAAFHLTSHIQPKIVTARQKELLDALSVAFPGSNA